MDQKPCEGFELFIVKPYLVEPVGFLGNLITEEMVARLVSAPQDREEEILAGAKRLEWIYELLPAPAYDRVNHPAAGGEDMHLYASIQDRVYGPIKLRQVSRVVGKARRKFFFGLY